eukprot:COSAG03_NODE_1790_length_3519_cov_4.091813_2_plen_88_part_00
MFAVSLSSPWFVAVLPAIGYVYGTMQKYFVIASRELKRLDNVSKSPIYAHFSETLNGITTIRCYCTLSLCLSLSLSVSLCLCLYITP